VRVRAAAAADREAKRAKAEVLAVRLPWTGAREAAATASVIVMKEKEEMMKE
jgi:hypothetical protein